MKLINLLIAVCSILFLMIGADKFLNYLEPPCSLAGTISPLVWKILGVLQLAAGVFIWLPKVRRPLSIFFFFFMLFFTIYHLTSNTTDVGGSIFMMILLGIIIWNPAFLHGNKK